MKKRKKLKCRWCGASVAPKPWGRPPVYCSASCRQRAYEGRKIMAVRDHYEPALLKRLKRDLAKRELKGLVREILVEAGWRLPPPPPPPKRRKPELKLVSDTSDEPA